MGTIDNMLLEYIWKDIDDLESVFTSKIYQILKKFKQEKNKNDFISTLEAFVEVDDSFLEKLKTHIENNIKSIDMNFEEYNTYNSMGNAYYYKEEYDKAIEAYQKAVAINPKNDIAYNNMGNAYYDKEEFDNAMKAYLKSLKMVEKRVEDNHPNRKRFHENFDIFMRSIKKHFFLNKNNSNLKFKIDKVRIENFKQYVEPFEIAFTKQINIVVGQNAVGKTSLLQAITLGLLKENSPDEERSYAKYISKEKKEAKVTIYHNDKEKKEIKILKDKREISSNWFIPFVLTYGSNFFTDYRESDPIVQKILNEEIEEDFAHTIFLEHTDKFWNPLSILRNLAISKHDKAKSKSKKKIFMDTLNSFLEVENYKIVPTKEDATRFEFIKTDSKTPLELSELSEGYRGNVLLITDMLIKILGVGYEPKTIEGIVLIDEFDRHLHPRWQSQLVDKMAKTFPNIQFIMTTHNPMSILDRESDEITIVKATDKGCIEAIRGRGTKQVDISVVLLEYFGVDAVIGKSMQEDIKNFNRLKLQKELSKKEKDELEALERKLSNTVASNFIYDRKYLKFLEFITEHKEIDFDKFETIDDREMDKLLEDFGDFFND